MNVEIGAEAALFPEKEYINGIAVAVHSTPVEPHGTSPQCPYGRRDRCSGAWWTRPGHSCGGR
jgi:hypothetical protein